MNKFEIIQDIFGDRKILYFAREAERAIGLEDLIENYFIAAYEKSEIFNFLDKSKSFCLDDINNTNNVQNVSVSEKSSMSLLKNSLTQNWIKDKIGDNFYAFTLFPSKPLLFRISDLGGELMYNDFDLTAKLENKINSLQLFQDLQLPLPPHRVVQIDNTSSFQLLSDFIQSAELVIQFEKGHTGNSTFFINNEADFDNLKKNFSGNKARVVKKIDGISLTINCCIYKDQCFSGPLQYQITGIEPFTSSLGTTVGNDFSYGSELIQNNSLSNQLENIIKKLSNYLIQQNYKGIFGLDLVWDKSNLYLIEVNARQTANMPFQTQLEILQLEQLPMMVVHMASLLNIDINRKYLDDFKNFPILKGSQIFVRAKLDNTILDHNFKSGFYRLQGDASAYNLSSDQVIFIDESEDMPLIFQQEGYKLNNSSNDSFLILFQSKCVIKNMYEELFRFQFNDSCLINEMVKPWIYQAAKKLQDFVINKT